MPVRPAPVQCRRAVCRHAVPSPAAVVRVPVEPCSRRSTSPRRCLNSHAGPLEGRRRMGKRHMTGLMPASSVYPPVWQFDAPPATTIPRWEPPTTPLYRRQKHERLGLSGLLNHFLSWLDHSHAEKPMVPPVAMHVHAVDSTAQYQATPEATSPASSSSSQANLEFVHLRSAIWVLENVDENSLQPLFNSCAHSLWHKLQSGELSPNALDTAVLDPLDSATRQRIPTENMADEMVASFRSIVLSALEAVQSEGDKSVDPTLWLSFAQRVCGTKGRRHDILLFGKLMRTMPTSLRAQVPPDHIAELARAVVVEHATRDDLAHRWSTQAHSFSRALQELTTTQRQNLDDDMRWFLLRQDRAVRERQILSFSWLIIKAYDTQATTADLLKTHVETAPLNTRVSSLNLWHLLAARFIGAGAVESEHSKLLLEAEYESLGQRWTFLVLALMASQKKDESLRELCSFLSSIGEFDTMAQALTERALPVVRIDAVQAIAIACNDHNRALALHDALLSRGGSERMLASWDWTMWVKYAERIIKDPAMDSWRIWDVLHLKRRSSKDRRDRDETASDVDAKVQLLDQISQWFMEATHINDRQLLRELEKVIYIQRGLTGTLTRQSLAHLTDLLTRDLSRGRRGRTERLEWLVQLVAQTQGMDKATRVASAIRGWRWTLARRRAAELVK
ncbi:hypothetical protein HRG_002696 [Hirsutella rhossiliensis]|uniref:Uncharacterized protein n=1 Tax=Hirsutella rhossiliensis TaxID=111463 RepID=A0A9P8N9X1_9HYPO|nr:uncharacterized protein HRG_02696 [Hirsutella rhossiliensis]KAH0967287.1 hypothetical protein HRG_02696 [Hirsutella rhossiliensis]